MLRVPVISSVGHHTDRTLIDDVAAVCCSTPTHAAEAAVPFDLAAARARLTAEGRRLRDHGRSALLTRARTPSALSRAPAQHLDRHRRRLHQLTRELRAGSRRQRARSAAATTAHASTLARTAARGAGSDAAARRRDLERLALALGAHDPQRTLSRGYALVTDRDGIALGSADAARAAWELTLCFGDGAVDAEVRER